jgi:hypothetical protein
MRGLRGVARQVGLRAGDGLRHRAPRDASATRPCGSPCLQPDGPPSHIPLDTNSHTGQRDAGPATA